MLGMTVCSGVGAPEVAAPWIDWRYQSEIEPFPCAVLAERFPDAVNLGDMTKFQEWPDANVDVLCGGTPCQAFSVAGLRKGLADPRGNLMLTYLAIAARYRPRWLVWENVPGVLSSNGGKDFGSFLGGLGELGYGFAYRVLDVQFGRTLRFPFAIPQRRRRVFVVGYIGDWRRAAAVLFDRESLSGNPPPRREAGQNAAPTLSARTRGGGGLGSDFEIDGGLIPETAGTLRAEGFDASEDGTGQQTLIPSHDPACTLTARDYKGPLPEADLSTVVMAFHPTQEPISSEGVCHTIGASSNATAAVAFAENDRGEVRLVGGDGQVAGALTVGGGKPGQGYPAVAFDLRGREGGAMPEGPHETANIRAASGGSSRSYVALPWAVRRLTPTECERLQGFPETSERVVLSICQADKWTECASAEAPCTTGPNSASSAGASASPQSAKNAAQSLSTNQAGHEQPVALHVLLDYEREAVEIRNAGRLIWSAKTADRSSESRLPMPPADFARLVALTTQTAEITTTDGRVVSHRNTARSTHLWSGERSVSLSGQEIDAHAGAVAMCMNDPQKHFTFTTSPSIANIPTSASTLTTLCCSVLTAIGSFIQPATKAAPSFSLLIESRGGFTRIPYRNKPADKCPDGPRYKALGNSWGVNAGEYVFDRIRMAEGLA